MEIPLHFTIIRILIFGISPVLFFACDDTNGTVPPVNPTMNQVVSGTISSNATWTSNRIYTLSGRVIVSNGVTLTIEPGTIVKGSEGEGSLASVLLIARGGKINASGTADKPIIFTSVLDDIQVGQKQGTKLDETDAGLWGGLIVLGKANVSVSGGQAQIEGIPANVKEGEYGGGANPINDDDSGVIRYVSIRYGGSNIGKNNEINGLTLGGVGSRTTIEYIEVVGNKDDGIECFGGTANITHALVWAQQDDAFDIDQAYAGTISDIIYIAGNQSDHGLEIDGPEGQSIGRFSIRGGHFKGLKGEYADFRDGAMGSVADIYFFNYPADADVELDADGSKLSDDEKNSDNPETSDNYAGMGFAYKAALTIRGLEFNEKLTDGTTTSIDKIFVDKWSKASFLIGDTRDATTAQAQSAANAQKFARDNSVVSSPSGKAGIADISAFQWTYANAKGALQDF